MNEELTSLEIVKRWKAQIHWNKDFGWDKEIATVEKELTDAEKYKKALDVIKEKKWLVEDIINAFIEDKEKYDFLKEILGNER